MLYLSVSGACVYFMPGYALYYIALFATVAVVSCFVLTFVVSNPKAIS